MKTEAIDLQAEVTGIFRRQQAYQHIVKESTAEERIERLGKLKSSILNFKDEIIEAMYNDFNKPPFDAGGFTGGIYC
jgi:aldehyde dehydrogenase (NAD+)